MAKLTPIKAIRAKCLDCSCGSFTEIKNCTVTNCALYEYRMGHRPKKEGNFMNCRFINASNEEVSFITAAEFMDDDIREDLHLEMGGHCSEAEFFDEYCRRHLVKYGEEFCIRMEEYND